MTCDALIQGVRTGRGEWGPGEGTEHLQYPAGGLRVMAAAAVFLSDL